MNRRRPWWVDLAILGGCGGGAVVVALLLEGPQGGAALPGVRISEVCPANRFALLDADGDPSDWIELENAGRTTVSVKGFTLSDDRRDPLRWALPAAELPPGGRLVVFASGKDRREPRAPHASFRLDGGGETLTLTDGRGHVLDFVEIQPTPEDWSFGRSAEAPERWQFFAEPTPGSPNDRTGWASLDTPYTDAEAPVVIAEVMPGGPGVLVDGDGDGCDWIELHNRSDAPVDLGGWLLGDDPLEPATWRLPSRVLAPGEHLLVLASGKDRVEGPELHASFRLDAERDVVVLSDPRRRVVDRVDLQGLPPGLSLVRDDGGAWSASAVPSPGSAGASAGFPVPAASVPFRGISEVMTANATVLRDEDRDHPDWIELVNRTEAPWDLAGHFLSDRPEEPRRWALPPVVVPPGGTLLVLATGKDRPGKGWYHANFKLSTDGGVLTLLDPAGRILDHFSPGHLPTDVSSGRVPERGTERVFFQRPTPGAPNEGPGASGITAPPRAPVPPPGFHPGPVDVDLPLPEGAPAGAVLRYTTDGRVPDAGSPPWTGPLRLERTTVVRARVFAADRLPGDTFTGTWFIAEDHPLPVVSVAVDPVRMFDPQVGIHARGPGAAPEFPHHGANYWKRVELPAHVEFLEADGRTGFALDAGFKIVGAYSRAQPQKSFQVTARDRYGADTIRYPLFPEKPQLVAHRAIVLRSGGQDARDSRIRDVLGAWIGLEMGLDVQAWRPVSLYLNGRYWGQYNIREKVDEHFVAANHGVPAEAVDLLEGNTIVVAGSSEAFLATRDYVRTHDLSRPEAWARVRAMVDVVNHADYQLAEIYSGNPDNGNIRRWRDRGAEGPFRWVLYDLDWAFRDPRHRTLAAVLNPEGTGAQDFFWTDILCGLMESPEFRDIFLERFAHHLAGAFSTPRVREKIQALSAAIEPEMPRHLARWGGTMADWRAEVAALEAFAEQRPAALVTQFQRRFHLDPATVEALLASSRAGGR